jgi:hypothetical protein
VSIKAKLKIVLQADETIVAESDDAPLWHKVLLAINQGTADLAIGATRPATEEAAAGATPPLDEAIKKMASAIGLPPEEVAGACGPVYEEPYLHLDRHCWEAMKRNTPERGPTAFSAIAIAGTLLAFWFHAIGKSNPTQAQAQAVLSNIAVRDQNPARGIERSEWLQSRPGGVIVLNPAKISKAVAIAQSFCSKKWSAAAD